MWNIMYILFNISLALWYIAEINDLNYDYLEMLKNEPKVLTYQVNNFSNLFRVQDMPQF